MRKEYVIKDLFGILIIVIVNVINHVMLENVEDYKNCKCRNKLVDKLVEEYSKNIDGNELIYNGTLSDSKNVCNSCTIYIVLILIAFLIIISISSAFLYFHWYLKRKYTETTIY